MNSHNSDQGFEMLIEASLPGEANLLEIM